MKTKHTNGQWYVLPHSKQIYIAVQDEVIATINSLRITQGESEANAKIIAAAPNMLEALEEMVRLQDIYLPKDYDHIKAEHHDEMVALVRALRQMEQAIKRATE